MNQIENDGSGLGRQIRGDIIVEEYYKYQEVCGYVAPRKSLPEC